MAYKAQIVLIVLGLASVRLASGESKLKGDNVCNKTVIVRKDQVVKIPVTYEIKYDGICGILPCTKTKTEVRMDSKLMPTTEYIQVATCCQGYAETPSRRCAPICFDSCNNGKCFLPNVCKCDPEPTDTKPGYVGSTCNRFTCLAVDRWGANCDRECNCGPNSYCSASNGKCLCRAGWRGTNCTEECDSRSRCDDIELPPIMDPEVNVIDDTMGSPHLDALSLERTMDRDGIEQKSVASLVAAHMGLNLLLIMLTTVLVAAIVWYRKRVETLRNELYYTTYSPDSSSVGSNTYSNPSHYDQGSIDIQKRPRMPTPLETDLLGKNLSFATATRDILTNGGKDNFTATQDNRHKYILAPRIESHLASSQRSSEQNIYSDIDSVLNVNTTIPEEKILNVSSSSEESPYQVPKPLSQQRAPNKFALSPDLVIDLNQTNLYEEIKPRAPSSNSDQ